MLKISAITIISDALYITSGNAPAPNVDPIALRKMIYNFVDNADSLYYGEMVTLPKVGGTGHQSGDIVVNIKNELDKFTPNRAIQ